ncbi:class I SAM-dependent methyltransferase [Photobacterium sp. CCB-ST2H9]|uniref:class I SAM-dependent methyltransferase n=1 Tax=unclassified Photobacterium TaxID=2628852 RepID=UPI002002AA73|nr:class I SAM-dependent methyltransferase [Photobacterium sp. CCB-ST2H9]UTM57226.1 class I SAM-dependent methyltransferase [Photobacterium sp. CCB-ST2H9]
MTACTLCGASALPYHEDRRRGYLQCQACHLIFADPASHLSPSQEKAVYDQHENHVEDEGYRGFLDRLATPLKARLPEGSLDGLDFGCGPGPALAAMFREQGHRIAVYDPYYAPDNSVLERQYDFVTCTEAIEHFYTPAREWQLLLSLVKPGGWLGLMTKLATDVEAFSRWHYKNDPTHVSFFSRETFRFLAERDGLTVEFVGNDVIMLRKNQS